MRLPIPCILAAVAMLALDAPPLHAHPAKTCDTGSCAVGVALEQACPCDAATNHRQYVRCVAHAVKELVGSKIIERRCRGHVVALAAQSVCGHPNAVICLVPTSTCADDGTCTNDPTVDCGSDTDCGTRCAAMTSDGCDTANGTASVASSCAFAGCFSPSGAFLD